MTHNCIDWEATPLRFLTISYGNKKVATQKGPASKVREFKALQSFVHRKFSIKDRPLSSVRFRTTCNLSCTTFEDHSAFEVDEEAWEEEGLRDLVCCLEVWLCDSEEVLPGPSSGVDGELGEEALKPEEESEDTQVHEQVRVSGEREDIEGESNGDVAEDKDSVEDEAEVEQEEEEQEEEKQEEEEKEREEESALRTRPSGRRQRVVVSDDEDSLKEFDRDLAADLQQKNKAAEVVDGPQPSAPIAKNRAGSTSAIHAQDIQRTPDIERPVKKEKEPPLAHRVRQSSPVESSHEGRAPSGAASGRPIKQEPIIAARSASQSQATHATQDSESAPELTQNKLVISIQHKPSAQHAQFSTKPHTRVGRVLTGACKSFRLDVNVAQLYLVVVTQNDQGLKEEDYFLCDRNETVETALVGVDGRAEFMIRMPEDPVV